MEKVLFKIIDYGSDVYKEAVKLREDILRKPLGLMFLPEELEKERDYAHVVGVLGNQVVATAVLVPEGNILKMQRVAVNSALQGQGVGSAMAAFCETYAKTHGFKEIYCHVRDTAVAFYEKNGYVPDGDYFDEDTIPHLKMQKSIDSKDEL